MRVINKEGLEIIKQCEGLSLVAYYCPANVLTIGYGHTKTCWPGMPAISKAQAEILLLKDCEEAQEAVEKLVKVPLNDNQFSALVSFVFNLGETNFRSSTMLKRINEGNFKDASYQFLRWVNANGAKLDGLITRRQSERKLFLKQVA
jgi:lysozyme